MLVYLAGPIDGIPNKESRQWRYTAAKIFHKSGISCFNPAAAYSIAGTDDFRSVIELNSIAITRCDAILVNLSGPGKAIGSIREIEFAKMYHKPVIVVLDSPHQHMALNDVVVCGDLDSAIESTMKTLGYMEKQNAHSETKASTTRTTPDRQRRPSKLPDSRGTGSLNSLDKEIQE